MHRLRNSDLPFVFSGLQHDGVTVRCVGDYRAQFPAVGFGRTGRVDDPFPGCFRFEYGDVQIRSRTSRSRSTFRRKVIIPAL